MTPTSSKTPHEIDLVVSFIVMAILMALLTTPGEGLAQSESCDHEIDLGIGALTGDQADFARAAELIGVAPLRHWMIRATSSEMGLRICEPNRGFIWDHAFDRRSIEAGLSIGIIRPRLQIVNNSAYANNRNSESLWAGRGLGTAMTGGVAFNWNGFSGALLPTLTYQQNRDFETVTRIMPPGYSNQIYPWHPGRIDWPQRPGVRSALAYDLGQSYLRFQREHLDITLATENLWWGPAQRYPLILSNTAPGFAHLALGTAEPVPTRIGALETRVVWGHLQESDHYDGIAANDGRLFAGLIASLQPAPLPGFYLGFSSARVIQLDQLRFHRMALAPLIGAPGGDEPHPAYHLFSIFTRWAFPDAGFEFYGEWGTNATWSGIDDFLREPGRGGAYVVGFQKVTPTGRGWIRTYGEHVNLGGSPKAPADGGGRPFYTDERIPQGHTHRGELLGAAIGPGSDAQILGLDLFTSWGRIGGFVERIRYDEDAYFTHWTRYYGRDAHDIALAAGLRQLLLLGDFQIGWKTRYEKRKNRNLLRLDGHNWDLLEEKNWTIQLEVGWRPGATWHSIIPTIATSGRARGTQETEPGEPIIPK